MPAANSSCGSPAGPPRPTPWAGVALLALFTGLNIVGVATGRVTQNAVTAAKVLALGGVVVAGVAAGTGAGWSGSLPSAPAGLAVFGGLAAAFPSVIWTYYGWVDAAKIAEEVVEPGRTLPRVFLGGIAVAAVLYLLLNAAFLNVLPLDQVAASNLVAADVASAIFGSRAGSVIALLALLVVLASLNGNIFVTPRVLFGLAREGLAPAPLTRVNAGGTPWVATLLVAVVALALAGTGGFNTLLSLAVALLLIVDGVTVAALFRLRARSPEAPFRVPLYPYTPALFIVVSLALLVGASVADLWAAVKAVALLVGVWALSWAVKG